MNIIFTFKFILLLYVTSSTLWSPIFVNLWSLLNDFPFNVCLSNSYLSYSFFYCNVMKNYRHSTVTLCVQSFATRYLLLRWHKVHFHFPFFVKINNGCSSTILKRSTVSEHKNNGRYVDLVTPVRFGSVRHAMWKRLKATLFQSHIVHACPTKSYLN